MKQLQIYNKLVNAYSPENLNYITGKLVEIYKNKNNYKIRKITNYISEFIEINEEKDVKCFARLIKLYHPDKAITTLESIEQSYHNNDYDTLSSFSHILLLDNIDLLDLNIDYSLDTNYKPEYTWDYNQEEGYQFFNNDTTDNEENDNVEFVYERSFYNAIKLRMYGNLVMEFPSYYLEEFELYGSQLESLEGVQHCLHATLINVSDNELIDISELWELSKLRELYLANNNIGYIDALSNLIEHRTLDISNNNVADISPHFNLENLEYVNLIGNPVSKEQIIQLRKKCTMVMI